MSTTDGAHTGKPRPVLLLALSLGPGGTELQMAGIAAHLDRSRFQPHVCVFRMGWMTTEDFSSLTFPVFHLPVTSLKSWSAVSNGRRLFSYIRRHGIVLTHSWDSPTNVFSFPVARAAGVDVILTSQRGNRGFVPQPYRTISRILDRLVDGVVVDSTFLVNHMIQDEKAPASQVFRSFNGIDLKRFTRVPGPLPAVLEGSGPVIGVVALLRPEKNIQLLLRAFARVVHLRTDLKLIVVGDGPELMSLLDLRTELGLDRSVCVFEPATKDVPFWLRAMDIFVLPSRSEAFSNSLVEAMAMGCCGIAASIDGNLELIEHGITGLLFDNDDVDSLAGALKLAIENEPLRRQLGENAERFIRERFSWENSARNMAQIYEELLDKHVPR